MAIRQFDDLAATGGAFEREQPARAASVASDVLVPALQSAITGLIGGAAWGGGAYALGGEFWPIFGATAAIFAGATWLVLLSDHRRALWAFERRTGLDVDRNSAIGKPAEPDPRFVVVNGKVRREDDTEHVLRRAYSVGLGFRSWEGYVLPSGKKIDRDGWQGFLDVLARANLIEPGKPGASGRFVVDLATALEAFGCAV